jgi:hypothetical protein
MAGRRLGPPGGVAVVARGAEAAPPLGVEGPPPRLVRQARVRLRARRDQLLVAIPHDCCKC